MLGGRALRQLLAIERHEIDLVEVERRKATVPGDIGHDAEAGETTFRVFLPLSMSRASA